MVKNFHGNDLLGCNAIAYVSVLINHPVGRTWVGLGQSS